MLAEDRKYPESIAEFDLARGPFESVAAADPEGSRAHYDLLRESNAIFERLARRDPDNRGWMQTLADQRTVLDTLLQAAPARDSGVRLVNSGMATLIDYASRPDASVNTLDQATSARLAVTPLSLRDAPWIVGPNCARARPRSILCSWIE